MTVKDLLILVKKYDLFIEVDDTEEDFQCVINVTEAIWTYGKEIIKEIQSPVDSDTFLRIII